MALYKVDSDTADLTKVAGGTLYADLPIGSWVKNDMATIPSGFLKVGDTISQSEYPELYAKYGSTVPYKADTSELSEYENITLSTNSSNPTVMPYDGVYILANYGVSYIHNIYLNGVKISAGITGNDTTGASTSSTILFKKGDTMYRLNTYIESSTFVEHVAYYKKSLIVKAKHTPVPANFMDAVDDAVETAMTKYDYTIPYAEQNTLEKVVKELVRRIASDSSIPSRSTFNVFLEWQTATIIQVNVAKFNANWVVVNGSSADAMFWGGQVNNEWKWHQS